MAWIPNAPEQEATEIAVLLVNPKTPVSGWPGKRGMKTSLIGSIPIESEETAWVVSRLVAMPDLSPLTQGQWQFFQGKDKKDLESDGLRALVFGEHQDGLRVIYDCAVQKRPA